MPRITKPLTNTEVKQAKPKDREYNLADGDGLSLRVKPTGTKVWLFNYYRPFTKKRANLSPGNYPDVSLAAARKYREKAKTLLAKNIDPQEHKRKQEREQQAAGANTLERITRRWFAVKKTKVTQSYAQDIIRSLESHILPQLGKLPISEVSAPSTIDVLNAVAAGGKLEMVKRLAQRLNEVMTFAVNTGLLKANPLAGIRHAFESPNKKKMPALRPEDLPELMHAFSVASIRLTTRCLIEWQLHTMVRPNEAAGARWDEIDLKKALWSISPERMKMRRGHVVPLTTQALALLEVMRPISGHSVYVFPSDRDSAKHANESSANVALRRMGFQGRLVAHGMRSIASTALNEQGFDPDVIEAALAHLDKNEVRAAYNRAEYLERRRVMMTWWSDFIEQAAIGNMSLAAGDKALRALS